MRIIPPKPQQTIGAYRGVDYVIPASEKNKVNVQVGRFAGAPKINMPEPYVEPKR